MNVRGTGVTGELWEKLVNLENLEAQRAVELILWGCMYRNPTPEDLQTLSLAVFAEVQVQNEPFIGAFEEHKPWETKSITQLNWLHANLPGGIGGTAQASHLLPNVCELCEQIWSTSQERSAGFLPSEMFEPKI